MRLRSFISGFAAVSCVTVPIIAEAASCNGRFSNSTFFPTGAGNIYRVGGSHDPTETVTFTIASGVMERISIQLDGGAMLCNSPATCDGLVFTANAAQDYFFLISGKASGGNAVVNATCQAASTGPDTDGGGGMQTGGGTTPPAQTGAPTPQQQGANITSTQMQINSARLTTSTAGASAGSGGNNLVTMAPTGGLGGSNRLDLGFSTHNLKANTHQHAPKSSIAIWSQARFTQLTSDDTGIDGPVLDARIGLEYEIADGVTIGGHGSLMTADVSSTPLATSVEETRFGGGLHVRLDLDDNISATADVMYEAGTADIVSAGASGSTDVSRFSVSASLNGSFAVNGFVLSPRAMLGVMQHDRDAYTNSLGTVIGGSSDTEITGQIGLRAGYPIVVMDGPIEAITPFFDLSALYFSEGDTDVVTVTGSSINDTTIGGAVELGLDFDLAGEGRFGLSAGLLGIGRDTMGVTGAMHLHLPLN